MDISRLNLKEGDIIRMETIIRGRIMEEQTSMVYQTKKDLSWNCNGYDVSFDETSNNNRAVKIKTLES